jgi:spore germination cell wall hydrolase CwlJ-like protein
MRISTGAGGVAAAMLLLLLGTFNPTPSRAWQMNPQAAPPAPAPEASPETVAPAAPAPVAAPQPTAIASPAASDETAEADAPAALDKAEQDCLATAVYFEAKGEPSRGQMAVAEVILNRTRSGRFPSSICGVVKQRGQFSFVHGSHLPGVPHGSAGWHKALSVARTAMEGSSEPVAHHALFFHARGVSAGWHAVRVAQIGNQVFYR